MELAFWLCVFWVFYAFAGYPLVVFLLARVINRPVCKKEIFPRVTVIIAAYNEAQHIVETVNNKLAQDYPADRLNVIVVSDESDDDTDQLVDSISSPRVILLRQSPRQGKTAALNLALPMTDGEIIVFADANSVYAPDAIRQLVRSFADPEVGYASGRMVYQVAGSGSVADGCSAYMRLENTLRHQETRLGSIVGVNGGIDAVRRELYRPMNADQLPDFVLPLLVRKQGYRVVYEPRARLVEDALTQTAAEFRMRVRVTLRALWALSDLRSLFNPFRYGLFSWQLLSHKLLRYTAFLPLIALLPLSITLTGSGLIYQAALVSQALFYLLAITAVGRTSAATWQALPYYFLLLNAASAKAAWKFLRRQKQVIWQPRVGA